MKKFRAFIAEVEKPKSQLDKKVFAQHPVKVTEYPVANAGERDVKTSKDNSRKADKVNNSEVDEADSGEVRIQSGRAYSKSQIMQYFKPESVEVKKRAINATSGSTDNPKVAGSSLLKKESEDIQEVSKKRLKDYIDANHAEHDKDSSHDGDDRKAKKRSVGLFRAYDKKRGTAVKVKATNESEDLQEISKKRLGNYIDAARDRIKTRSSESTVQQKNIDNNLYRYDKAKHNMERNIANRGVYQAAVKKEKIDKEIGKRKEGIKTAAKKFNKKKTGE